MEALMGENDDKTPAGDWYCPDCEDCLCAERVNHDETCDTCGTTVEWIEADDPDAPEGRATVEEVVAHLRGEVARLTRERDDLRVDAEVLSDRYAEVRALADAYIDIVNRTARALGIPEVDEAGASPSLHDVPERVADVVRLAAVLRDPRILRRIDDVREGGGTSAANDLAADLLACMDAPPPAEPNRRTGRGVLNIVFCGEPPNLTFVEAETADGRSVRAGRWLTEGNFSVLALDSLLPAPFVSNEPTDDDATQDPPGWGVCGKVIPGSQRAEGPVRVERLCMDEPGHDGPCRFDARADGGEVPDAR